MKYNNLRISNTDLWDSLRSKFPNFSNITSKATAEMFTTNGWEQLKNNTPDLLNDFFQLSMRVFLQQVNISHAKDNLAENGFGEYYDQPRGGFIQRLAISTVNPISAGWVGLNNGDSIDPFIVRKPKTSERIFNQNFNYASLITIPDDFTLKQIFIADYGMSEFMGGIMQSMLNGHINSLYVNKLEVLSKGINSVDFPLQDTQKISVAYDVANPTEQQLKDFLMSVRNVITAMAISSQTGAFNSINFNTVQETGRLKLLIRAGFKTALAVNLLSNSYNIEQLNLPIDVIEVPNFGGLKPYKEVDYITPLYPVYDKVGEMIGYAETEGATATTVETKDAFLKDINENVIAILADKGYIFFNQQNPYTVEPIRNARGRYTNYWASSPNNSVCVDHLYNAVIFNKTAS